MSTTQVILKYKEIKVSQCMNGLTYFLLPAGNKNMTFKTRILNQPIKTFKTEMLAYWKLSLAPA